jgi:ribosomal protein S12 methylthiotransferase accessory factor
VRQADDLVAAIEPLVDARSGVLGGLARFRFHDGFEGETFAFGCPVGSPQQLHDVPPNRRKYDLDSAGSGLDETTARVRALVEGLERYCSFIPSTAGAIVASARELGDEALDPRRLPQCSPAERERAPAEHRLKLPDPDAKTRWIKGYSLTRRKPLWIPLTAVFLGLPEPDEEHLAFAITTGFAAGTTYEQAVLAGLCEVIERDSLTIWWLLQLPMPHVELRGLDPRLDELLRKTERTGVRTDFIDLTTDVGVPVIAAVQRRARAEPVSLAYTACRLRGEDAALRAMEEASYSRLDTRSFLDSSGFWERPDADPFAFATASPNRRDTLPRPVEVGPGGAVETLVWRLAGLGMEVLAVEATLPEVRDVGIKVVRVIVPELMPMTIGTHIRLLAHPRLYAVPARLGYGERTEADVTSAPLPH